MSHEKDSEQSPGKGTRRGRKDTEKRAKVVQGVQEDKKSYSQIARELGQSPESVRQLAKKEGSPRVIGKKVIYQRAHEAGLEPREFLEDATRQKNRPGWQEIWGFLTIR